MQLLRMFYKDKDLVVSATRTPKDISHIAENVTVITAEEIEAMNAHTLADVLNSVPGIFISSNQDLGASSLIGIQGSLERHVLVLMDEVPWNYLSGGNAETSSIPIGAIERIEIIKGPASSAWGSSLGGVINIITKETGKSEDPSGSVRASYGTAAGHDYRAEISGEKGPVGYYLYAGDQGSDGLVESRYYDNSSFYSRFDLNTLEDTKLGFTAGYGAPETGYGDNVDNNTSSSGKIRTFFTTVYLDTSLSDGLDFRLSVYHFKNDLIIDLDALGMEPVVEDGTLLEKTPDREKTSGARGQIVWTQDSNTTVLGMEYDRGDLTNEFVFSPIMQELSGTSAEMSFDSTMSQRAVYFNQSRQIGDLSITPGIRYDYNDISGSFISPSMGMTYGIGRNAIIRGSVSRGFTTPPLAYTSGGGLFLSPNPTLEPEKIWSYQSGLESHICSCLWFKFNMFYHSIEDILTIVPYGAGSPSYNDIYINGGKGTRKGMELETETVPFYNMSLSGGFSYTDITSESEDDSSRIYSIDIRLSYDDNESVHAGLSGRYRWWDMDDTSEADYDSFIWDLNISKGIMILDSVKPELFFTAHNIFNDAYYLSVDQINPDRWMEAGIKLTF